MVKFETKRLLLRSIELSDAERINLLVNDKEITSTTLRIPYPSSMEDTQKWIETHHKNCEKGDQAVFGIILKDINKIIGVISLDINNQHENAELGYWIGKSYWRNGYCTEAAEAILKFGFQQLKLHRIFAFHMKENSSSERVMQKIGMKYEGLLKHHIKKDGNFKDIKVYGIIISSSPRKFIGIDKSTIG